MLPLFFYASLVTSLLGGANYAIWRAVERELWPTVICDFITTVTALFYLVLIVFVFSWAGSYGIPILCGVCALAGLAGWFHRRAHAGEIPLLRAFAAMFAACVCSAAIGGSLLASNQITARHSRNPHQNLVDVLDFWGPVLYTVLAPLALWIWKASRPRPGVDTPVKEP